MEEQTTQGIDLSVFLHNFRRTLQHFFWSRSCSVCCSAA